MFNIGGRHVHKYTNVLPETTIQKYKPTLHEDQPLHKHEQNRTELYNKHRRIHMDKNGKNNETCQTKFLGEPTQNN